MPGSGPGGITRTSTSPSPPTAGSSWPTCTPPPVGMPAQPASAATATATARPRRGLGIGDLGRRVDALLVGLERQRRLLELRTGPPRQGQPEDRPGAGLPPSLQPATVQPRVLERDRQA